MLDSAEQKLVAAELLGDLHANMVKIHMPPPPMMRILRQLEFEQCRRRADSLC